MNRNIGISHDIHCIVPEREMQVVIDGQKMVAAKDGIFPGTGRTVKTGSCRTFGTERKRKNRVFDRKWKIR